MHHVAATPRRDAIERGAGVAKTTARAWPPDPLTGLITMHERPGANLVHQGLVGRRHASPRAPAPAQPPGRAAGRPGRQDRTGFAHRQAMMFVQQRGQASARGPSWTPAVPIAVDTCSGCVERTRRRQCGKSLRRSSAEPYRSEGVPIGRPDLQVRRGGASALPTHVVTRSWSLVTDQAFPKISSTGTAGTSRARPDAGLPPPRP